MFFSSNVLGCYTYKIESPYYLRGLCSQSLAVTQQRRRFSSVSSQNLLNMAPISRNSLWFIFHLIASLPCRPTPCRRRGRMRTASKIPVLLKRQAARRRGGTVSFANWRFYRSALPACSHPYPGIHDYRMHLLVWPLSLWLCYLLGCLCKITATNRVRSSSDSSFAALETM